jgi:hypothetical protein
MQVAQSLSGPASRVVKDVSLYDFFAVVNLGLCTLVRCTIATYQCQVPVTSVTVVG